MGKRKKTKKLSYYKNRAWVMFSRFIRTRDCLATTKTLDRGVCVTCNRQFGFKELQSGHALGGRNNAILFDEELVNAQCRGCNGYGGGNYGVYSLWFIKKYGMKEWEEKVIISKTTRIYKKGDYEAIYEDFKERLGQLLRT